MGSTVNIGTPSNNTVATAVLQDDAVTTAKIAASNVTATELGANAVITSKIADDAVTAAKIANNTITATQLNTDAVDTDALQVNSVTTAKIADDAVTGDKIATNLDLPDNNKIRFGTGNDLQIHHDGSNSKLTHGGAGGLYIGADTFALQKGDHSENYIAMSADGAVELFHDGSKKFETTSAGNQVSGNLVCGSVTLDGGGLALSDNDKVRCGNGDDLQIFHDGSDSYIRNTTNTDLIIHNQGNAGIQIKPQNSYPVELYYNASKKFETTSLGVKFTGTTSHLNWLQGSNDDKLRFNDGVKAVFGNGDDLQIYHDGSRSVIAEGGTGPLRLSADEFQLMNVAQDETMIYAAQNLGVSLNYNNSTKFETTSTGVNVTDGELRIGDNTSGNDALIRLGSIATNVDTHGVIFYDGTQNHISFLVSGESHGTHGLMIKNGGDVRAADIKPHANNSYDLGSTSLRWANIYTNDLNLSNEGSSNDVDGTWGDWTIQEGESDLFLKNNRSGKKYKFNLTEVS